MSDMFDVLGEDTEMVLTPMIQVDELGAFYISPWFREELKDIFREVINEKIKEKKEN